MYIRSWKKEVFTIPNLLSFFRLILVPVYAGIYLNAADDRAYRIAGAILAVSCLTDLIDGKIARHFQMVSTLGKVLDPLADKVTQLVLTLCLSRKHPELLPLLGLLLVKELFQVVMGLFALRKGKMLTGALMAGKVCTTVLFVSLIALVLLPEADCQTVRFICVIDSLFVLYAFFGYFRAYFGNGQYLQDIP